MDWIDQSVLINADFKLSFDALLKLLTQLPQYAIVCIREWSSSDSFKLLHALDAEWIKVAKEEIESIDIFRCVNCEYRYACYKSIASGVGDSAHRKVPQQKHIQGLVWLDMEDSPKQHPASQD